MYWNRPSFLAFLLQGLLFAVFVVYFINNYKVLSKRDMMFMILLVSVTVGIHSMLHDREERYYGYNPFDIIRFSSNDF
jgi:hypothetical protein